MTLARTAVHPGAGGTPGGGSGRRQVKRDCILDAATRLFLEHGYGKVSMDAVASDAGVSKQTVYAHFGAKDALFEEIVERNCAALFQPVADGDLPGDEPRDVLARLGRRFLTLVLSDDSVRHFRCIIGECDRFPELAAAFYRSGPRAAADRLAAWLAEMARAGRLTVADPNASAGLFFGMLRGDLYMRRITGLAERPEAAEIARHVDLAVDTFLAAHGAR